MAMRARDLAQGCCACLLRSRSWVWFLVPLKKKKKMAMKGNEHGQPWQHNWRDTGLPRKESGKSNKVYLKQGGSVSRDSVSLTVTISSVLIFYHTSYTAPVAQCDGEPFEFSVITSSQVRHTGHRFTTTGLSSTSHPTNVSFSAFSIAVAYRSLTQAQSLSAWSLHFPSLLSPDVPEINNDPVEMHTNWGVCVVLFYSNLRMLMELFTAELMTDLDKEQNAH